MLLPALVLVRDKGVRDLGRLGALHVLDRARNGPQQLPSAGAEQIKHQSVFMVATLMRNPIASLGGITRSRRWSILHPPRNLRQLGIPLWILR